MNTSAGVLATNNWTTSQYQTWVNKLSSEVKDGEGVSKNDLAARQKLYPDHGDLLSSFLSSNFDQVDLNRDGVLGRNEIKAANLADGKPLFNLTQDQTITVAPDQFISWFDKMAAQGLKDTDAKTISKNDLQDRMTLGDAHGMQTPRAAFLLQNFEKVDTNRDGVLNQDEVKAAKLPDGQALYEVKESTIHPPPIYNGGLDKMMQLLLELLGKLFR